MSKVVLHNIDDAVEWQCAHEAVKHAEKGVDYTLEYEVPTGSLELVVRKRGKVIHVQKVK